MQFPKQAPTWPAWLRTSPRFLCIIVFVCVCLFGLMSGMQQAFAATPTSAPGGKIADPVVRQVDIARPAVVRIITKLGGHLTVQFPPTSASATFPLGGGSYPLELSGSGAFISSHGDILTADHVVNPPHDQGIDDELYQLAAPDIANYINTHFKTNQPYTGDDVLYSLQSGVFPSTSAYDPASSEVYQSTAYAGPIDATKFKDIPAKYHAKVDHIEAQSAFDAMDVAIIHVSGMDDMPSIQLGDSSQVAEQDNLTVIGFPGLADESNSPTNLLTSSINKVYVSAIKTTDTNAPVIQVGGNVEHGDSGGPVLDENGHIVGIVSFGLANPNEIGATSFLQASNSARDFINALHLDTTPGPFQKLWAQAFNDYAATTSGHWHKASQEFQQLADNHPNFLGVATYLSYVQTQAGTEQLPQPPAPTGPNPGLIVGLVLVVLALLGGVIFVVMKRRAQVVPAQVPGMYGQFQTGMPGAYTPQPASYSAGNYPSQPGATSGTYPPVPASYNSGTGYPPMPASYSGTAWHDQATSTIPQTSPNAVPVPVAAIAPTEITGALAQAPLAAEDSTVLQFSRPFIPEWAALPQTPQPAPLDEMPTYVVSPSGENEAPAVAQDEAATIVTTDVPAVAAEQPDLFTEMPTTEIEPPALASSEPQVAQPAARSFSVPRRPTMVSQEEAPVSTPSGVHTWVAPCGHNNTPDVRFCRVCGQPAQTSSAEQ